MPETYNCPRHNKTIEMGQMCERCVSEIKSYKNLYGDFSKMETERRLYLFDRWASKEMAVLTVDFDDLHELMELLAGREVWLHELARPQDIREEILFEYKRSFVDVLDDLEANYPDKKIITQEIKPEDKDKWN